MVSNGVRLVSKGEVKGLGLGSRLLASSGLEMEGVRES